MRKIVSILALFTALTVSAQRGFIIKGNVPSLSDGTEVGIGLTEDSITEIATATVKNGKFELRGKVDHPTIGILSTNNLKLIEQKHWPEDSIKWNYIDVFLSNDDLFLDKNLKVTGSKVQADFNELMALGDGRDSVVAWTFISQHPQSAVSAYLLNNMLKEGFGLTAAQVDRIEHALTAVPDDPSRWNEFQWRVKMARKATKGSPLIDLEITDINNKVTHLSKVIPQETPLTLVDFWASWCGQCLEAFPELEEIAKEHKALMTIVDLSIDVKEPAWRNAMKRHPQPWQQYRTTANGYQDLFKKYQINNGVPYFLMVTKDGKVIQSLRTVDEIKQFLTQYIQQ